MGPPCHAGSRGLAVRLHRGRQRRPRPGHLLEQRDGRARCVRAVARRRRAAPRRRPHLLTLVGPADPFGEEREFDTRIMRIAKRSPAPIVLTAGLLVAAVGCGHSGITVEGNACSAAAATLDPAETAVLTAAVQHLYDRGELRISQETALTGFWSPVLLP